MRKTNSKGYLQTNNLINLNQASSMHANSPSQGKQQQSSMIQIYKMKAHNTSSGGSKTGSSHPPGVGITNTTSLISKVISAKRNAAASHKNDNSTTNHHAHYPPSTKSKARVINLESNCTNTSAQQIKHSNVLSPGVSLQRKNDTLIDSRNISQMNKNSTAVLVQPNQILQINDTISNIKSKLSKQKSLQTFFSSTQKLSNLNRQTNALCLKSSSSQTKLHDQQQREVQRRGSKFSATYGYNSNLINHINLSNNLSYINNSSNQQIDKTKFENQQKHQQQKQHNQGQNLTLTRIRSAFLNFNQTQPSLILSKTLNNTKDSSTNMLQLKSRFIQESPSVSSSEDEPQHKGLTLKAQIRMASISNNPDQRVLNNNQTRNHSKQPNGSFIEQKMINCLHSRNANQTSNPIVSYQTHQEDIEESQKSNKLTKIMSQPQLHRNLNITQRLNAVKSSFFQRNDSAEPRIPKTPINEKTPETNMAAVNSLQQQKSLPSKNHQLNVLKGDMKSLNLSPIVPLNLLKNKQSYQSAQTNSQDQTIDTTTRKLDMVKESVISSKNKSSTNNRSYLSLKKEVDPNSRNIPNSKDNTTEKKMKAGFLNFKLKQGIRDAQNSQETERVHDYAKNEQHFYTTTDEFDPENKDQGISLRILHTNESKHQQEIQLKKQSDMIQKQIQKKQVSILNNQNQNLIKVTQILNNNNMNNSKRYQINENQEHIYIPNDQFHKIKTNPNQTPRAIPKFGSFVETANKNTFIANMDNIKIQANEDDKTLKKHQNDSSSSSSFEDLPDAQEFEEFDLQQEEVIEGEKIDSQRLSTHPEELLKQKPKSISNNNIMSNYNTAALALGHKNNKLKLNQYVCLSDDRNSLVNYDQSLLTHQTARGENYQSPFSYLRPSKPEDQKDYSKIIPDSFITQMGVNDLDKTRIQQVNKAKLMEAYDVLQDQDEEPPLPLSQNKTNKVNKNSDKNHVHDESSSQAYLIQQAHKYDNLDYKNILTQIQKDEEETIENITKSIIESKLYKEMEDESERAKYLSSQILEVRKYYKQVLIENVLKHANSKI